MRSVVVFAIVIAGSVANAETPAQRARKFLDAQLATLTKSGEAKMESMIDPTAVISGFGYEEPLEDWSTDMYQAFAGGSPHARIKKVKVQSFAAGGTDSAMWLTAEVSITDRSAEPEFGTSTSTTLTRITELVVLDGTSWKIVAASYARPQSPTAYVTPRGPVDRVTPSGPLAELASSTNALAAALAKDAVVLGTDTKERAVGQVAAKKLLKSWGKLTLERDAQVREIRTETYGFVQTHVHLVKGKKRYAMTLLVIALPTADGGWSVGAVHYASL